MKIYEVGKYFFWLEIRNPFKSAYWFFISIGWVEWKSKNTYSEHPYYGLCLRSPFRDRSLCYGVFPGLFRILIVSYRDHGNGKISIEKMQEVPDYFEIRDYVNVRFLFNKQRDVDKIRVWKKGALPFEADSTDFEVLNKKKLKEYLEA